MLGIIKQIKQAIAGHREATSNLRGCVAELRGAMTAFEMRCLGGVAVIMEKRFDTLIEQAGDEWPTGDVVQIAIDDYESGLISKAELDDVIAEVLEGCCGGFCPVDPDLEL